MKNEEKVNFKSFEQAIGEAVLSVPVNASVGIYDDDDEYLFTVVKIKEDETPDA